MYILAFCNEFYECSYNDLSQLFQRIVNMSHKSSHVSQPTKITSHSKTLHYMLRACFQIICQKK